MTGQPTPAEPESTPDGPRLTPGVEGVGSAGSLAGVGHEIPTVLLPSLLTSTLGAPAAARGASGGDALAGAARFAADSPPHQPPRRDAGTPSSRASRRRASACRASSERSHRCCAKGSS